MLKTHLPSPEGVACGRIVRRQSNDTRSTTCLACKASEFYQSLLSTQTEAREAAYAAQEPHTVQSPFNRPASNITCRYCGHDLFRDYGRSLDHNNHRCASCGGMNHTLTETGMSA